MDIDEKLRAICEAEAAVRTILLDLEKEIGETVDWVKVETRDDCNVTIETKRTE